MIEGVIYLYDRGGTIVSAKQYVCKKSRDSIIEDWKTMYAFRFPTCYLQFSPSVKPEYVAPDGTNMRGQTGVNIDGKYVRYRTYIKRLKEKSEGVKIVRPPAVYDNNKSLYK